MVRRPKGHAQDDSATSAPEDATAAEAVTRSQRKPGSRGITALVVAGALVLTAGGWGIYTIVQAAEHAVAEQSGQQTVEDAEAKLAIALESFDATVVEAESLLALFEDVENGADAATVAQAVSSSGAAAYREGLVALLDVLDKRIVGDEWDTLVVQLEELARVVGNAAEVDRSDVNAVSRANELSRPYVRLLVGTLERITKSYMTAATAAPKDFALASDQTKAALTKAVKALKAADGFDPDALLRLQDALYALWASHSAAAADDGAPPAPAPDNTGTGGGDGGGDSGGGSAPPPPPPPPPDPEPDPEPLPNSSFDTRTGSIVYSGPGCVEFYGSGGAVSGNYASNLVIPSDTLNVYASDLGGGMWEVSFACDPGF